ncbi:hypothetical protein [Kitasatospora sp. NPDC088783]|uniref:hypothetical protein n=1 Tax=Kitasatospora sp. NPDC088783 TaxID=3364077 RepID=UPI0038022B43
MEKPNGWTLRVADPRQKLARAAVHYRGVAPASLAVYIATGQVHGQTMWALVVVIAILAITDVAARRTA